MTIDSKTITSVAELGASMSATSEDLAHLQPDVVAALCAAGLPQMLKPGVGGTFREFVDTCDQLAQGCMSAGWCNFVWGMHNYVIGLYPQVVQDSVWEEPNTLVSGSLGAAGQTTSYTGDSAVVSGHWRFNSGCDYADWLLLGFTQPRGEPLLGLFHKSEYQLVDDSWDVMGLRGTGSKDAVVDSVQIPAERILPYSKTVIPYGGVLILVIVGPVIGGAQSAVDEFALQLRKRKDTVSGQPLAEQQGMLLRLAESSAEVDAARCIVQRAAHELDANPTPKKDVTARILRDTAYAAKLCNQATRRVFDAAGGSALQNRNLLQSIYRNVTAGCNHARLMWDEQALPYAQLLVQVDDL